MRFYRNPEGFFVGTQSDAKQTFGKEWEEVDVPTTKNELKHFLNALADECASAQEDRGDLNFTPTTMPDFDKVRVHRAEQTQHNISVEEEIAEADLPTAIRLSEHILGRLQEHVRDAGRTPVPDADDISDLIG